MAIALLIRAGQQVPLSRAIEHRVDVDQTQEVGFEAGAACSVAWARD